MSMFILTVPQANVILFALHLIYICLDWFRDQIYQGRLRVSFLQLFRSFLSESLTSTSFVEGCCDFLVTVVVKCFPSQCIRLVHSAERFGYTRNFEPSLSKDSIINLDEYKSCNNSICSFGFEPKASKVI